jgi:hypothetical protein
LKSSLLDIAKIDGTLRFFSKTLLLKLCEVGSLHETAFRYARCRVRWTDEVAASGLLKDYVLPAPGLPEDVEDTSSLFQTSLEIL